MGADVELRQNGGCERPGVAAQARVADARRAVRVAASRRRPAPPANHASNEF